VHRSVGVVSGLRDRAVGLLRANDRGRYTVPSAGLYPHQWAWDSAFAAIGWAAIDTDRALTELETLLDGAWADGRIPHIRFHDLSGEYFPGPSFWGTTDRSSISQPPVWAAAAARVLERGGDPERVRALLEPIERSHRWFLAERDPLGWGMVAVAHPWESGMDNSPAWDGPLRAVDPAAAPPFQRVDRQHVDDPAQRPTDDAYARYAALVAEIAARDFGMPATFAVYDPGMSAMLAWGDRELAAVATALGEDAVAVHASERCARVTRALVEQSWDADLARFTFFDAVGGAAITTDVLSAYLPLLLDLPVPVAAAAEGALLERFDTPYPLPTTAPGDPNFDPIAYWRGPMWVNLNWLFDLALGGTLRERTLALIDEVGFREYFDPLSGAGLGAREFTWTAALTLDWLTRRASSRA
jgi:mannosylglycerate hydrolase